MSAGFRLKHVTMHKGKLYYQIRVPQDVKAHPAFKGKANIKRSLGTTDPRAAERKAALIGGEIHAEFERAREELIAMRTPRRVDTMTDCEASRFVDDAILAARMATEMPANADVAVPETGDVVNWAAGQRNLVLAPEVEALLRERLFTRLNAPAAPLTRSDHRLEEERRFLEPARGGSQRPRGKTLKQLIDDFDTDDGRRYIQKETRRNFATPFAVLRELVGDGRNIEQITREDFKAVRRILVHLPPYAKNPAYNPQYQDWPYAQIANDVIDRLESGEDVKVLKSNVVAKYLTGLNTLFKYAQTEGFVDENHAQNLIPRRRPGEEEEGRRPFSDDELRRMFPRGWTPKDRVDWFLLMGLFHGARGCELAQLSVDDIEVVDGVPVMMIRRMDAASDKVSADKRVKTGSSVRSVPLHRTPITLGFLDFVSEQKAAGLTTIFDTKPYGGYYYESIRDDITCRLRDLGVKTDRTAFHSLRHNFKDACRDARLPAEEASLLGGWSTGRGAEKRYGRGTLIKMLKESIDKVAYPIDL